MDTQNYSFGRLLSVGALLLATLAWTGCDSGGAGTTEDETLRRVSYDLSAQSNDGSLPDGVDATATFWELGDNQTLVTLELNGGATNTTVSHPAHIHNNTASEGGDIAIYLSPIDGTGGGGTSARVVNRPFNELADFNGYINIHESVDSLGNVVAQGNIGANADGQSGEGLEVADDPESTTYSLSANSNGGNIAPNGIPGEVTFNELTAGMTIVTLELNTNGATGASVSHPAHIHDNTASEGGDIQFYLSPVDGTDPAARSSKLVNQSYDNLTGFDGYVNVHESASSLGNVVSQGNIGANAGDGGGDSGGGNPGY